MSDNALIEWWDLVLDLGQCRMIRILKIVDEDIEDSPEDYANSFEMLSGGAGTSSEPVGSRPVSSSKSS